MKETIIQIQHRRQYVIDKLQEALSHKDHRQVCESSRDLTNMADYAYLHPDLWTPAEIESTVDLLHKAVRATVGTFYEANCTPRPQQFKGRVASQINASDARKVLERLSQVVLEASSQR